MTNGHFSCSIESMNERFHKIIGQESAKRKLNELIDCYHISRFVPPLFLTSPKGDGKTTLAIQTAKHLCRFNELGKPELNAETNEPRPKPLIGINCAALSSVKAFINEVFIPLINDKDVTVLFDEASEIPHSLSMAFLDIFVPKESNNYRTTLRHGDFICDFDFRRQSFIFCTSEPHNVFHALSSRFKRIVLRSYTIDELAQIIKLNLPDVEFEAGVIEDVASVARGNARGAEHLAQDIHNSLRGSKTFFMEEWDKFKVTWDIKPLGLNDIEIEVLRFLANNSTGTSLSRLSSKTGLTREALRLDAETFLAKYDLMQIETKGRVITAKGFDYLKALDEPKAL